MTTANPLALADFLTSKYDLFPNSEQMQAATLLRTQHAEIERKDALLRQALEAFEYQMKPLCMCFAGCAECDPATAPHIDQIEYAIKQELSK